METQRNESLDFAAVLCFLLVIAAFYFTTSATLSAPQVIGADWYYHIELSKILLSQGFFQACNYNLQHISYPYGFFGFQLLILGPSVIMGQTQLYSRILQILLLPTTFTLVLWVTAKQGGSKAAFIAGIMLLGCWSFVDGAFQVRPESLDLLLFPLIVLALMSTRKKTFAGLSALSIYSHGPAAFSNIYGLAANRLRQKSWRKTILLTLLIVFPVLAISAWYITGALNFWGHQTATSNPQELAFWQTPLNFIPNYMGATMIGIPFLFRRGKTGFESLLTWGVAGSLLMLPLWADRWLQYISIPLAMLAGVGISRMSKLKQTLIIVVLFIVFAFYYITFMSVSFSHLWWQPTA